MASTNVASMEVSKEDIAMELACSFVKKYNINAEAMLKLADHLDEKEVKSQVPIVSFPKLVEMLLDVNREVPGWLTVSDVRLNHYTSLQFRIIIKVVEARYWLGETEQVLEHLLTWRIVFALPRNVHRQMMSKKDFQTIGSWKVFEYHHYSFGKAMLPYFYEDMPDSYKSLRETYFPDGIDDAMPAFRKHELQARAAIIKLEKRIKLLRDAKAITDDCSLQTKSHRMMFETTKAIMKTTYMADRWEQFTKTQKEYYQLPGVDVGLPYGVNLHTDYETNRAFVIENPQQRFEPFWWTVDALYGPIRWRPGSPWIDFLRNIRQDHPAFRTMRVSDLKPKEKPDEEDAGANDDSSDADLPPVEVRIPDSVASSFMYYASMYQFYKAQYDVNDPNGVTRPITYTDKQAERVAKRLSDGTGEPWWKVCKFEDPDEEMIDMAIPDIHQMTGRPRFDALGNLRFDYMGAVLRELKTGSPVSYYTLEQNMVTHRRNCDDDTPYGEDLQ
ncbi:hypothetical protein PFICI_02944 [Pestalotiopsis fici W106-1]|uniref:Uncharacterized protein n=1 Tax=Pestalotiopsis fici (strain W106-1 / CGMCC3.15140) TaxID=1229662 RepID=W3XFY5_PESFW|nr:uncharacterized protein PFICI_02944 [Pestalotiopsis fici W106-1]ETS84919.1 hypothetical protein PFICI_02944 [Pestalotiopsis fici W106-1]